MSTTVKTGWLKDKNGDKFAPKTLISQVQTNDGILLEDKIQADLDAVKNEITNNVLPQPISAEVGQVLAVQAIDENNKVTETTGYNIANNEDIMDLLSELGAITPVTMSDNSILTSSTGEIYTL
jgi:hypothetical protein